MTEILLNLQLATSTLVVFLLPVLCWELKLQNRISTNPMDVLYCRVN